MQFNEMLDSVTKDIADNLESDFIMLGYSGGLDSTALLLSFMKTGKPIYCVHVNSWKGSSDEAVFQDFVAYHICTMLQIPLMIIPFEAHPIYTIHQAFPIHGIHEIVSGEGMDRAHQTLDTYKTKTMGMDFRCMHPILDSLLTTYPRFKHYKKVSYKTRAKDIRKTFDKFKRYRQEIGLEIIMVAEHELYKQYSESYTQNVKDLFFPKSFIFNYIKRNIGKPFNKIAKETYLMNKNFLAPFGFRVLRHLISKDKPNSFEVKNENSTTK